MRIAYFCAEYALDTRLPIYAGGLGVLAADHLKAAAERGVEMLAIGLLYGQGYFAQRLDSHGRQHEVSPTLDLEAVGLQAMPQRVTVAVDGEDVRFGAWRLSLGSASLVLLDADVEGNSD